MPNILTIAYTVEGPTDVRFLHNVIQRTFEDVAFLCEGEIDVYQAVHIPNPKTGGFIDNVIEIARLASDMGIHVLCVHTDADADRDIAAFENRINPAFAAVNASPLNLCKNLVAIVPVQMVEAWMLADLDLLRVELDTKESTAQLGIARAPETIADPKSVIENAVRLSQSNKPKKSRTLTISELYQPIGQKISMDALESLPSYRKFKSSVVQVFRQLNYLN
jgi:hypothetical protein